jgi:hypothetical protein
MLMSYAPRSAATDPVAAVTPLHEAGMRMGRKKIPSHVTLKDQHSSLRQTAPSRPRRI